MCDGTDENQQLLKLSRQLSELTSSDSSHLNEVPSPGIGSPWVQSSGLPSENHPHPHHPTPFSPLYTWDPSFLQAPSSSSPSPLNHHLSNPGFNLHQPVANPSSFPFPPPTNYGQQVGHIGNLSPNSVFPAHEVSGDLSGRFSNIPRSPPAPQDYDPIRSHNYHSQSPIVGHNFGGSPSPPKEDLFSDLSSVLEGDTSPLIARRNFDILHRPVVGSRQLHSNNFENIQNSNNSCDIASPNPFFQPPPSFDPRTPPPAFLLQTQVSDSPGQASNASPPSTEFLDFLRLQGDPSIGASLDLGATPISDTNTNTWQTFPFEKETVSSSEEGKQLYVDALNQWNSFEFSDVDNSKPSEDISSPAQIDVEVSSTESLVQSQEASKPSYSDIAKTPKVADLSQKVEPTSSDSTTGKARFVTKDGKPYRPLIQRTNSASKFWPKGCSDRVIDQPKVSPTSRYGLDSFEDGPSSVVKTSDSLRSTVKTKRSGSSAAVLDDLSLNMMEKNVNNFKDDNNSTQEVRPKTDQKTKSDMVDAKEKTDVSSPSVKMPTASSSASEPEEKLFFDPKRIFQPKNTNKSRAQSPAQKVPGKPNFNENNLSEDTVLNNGKPTPSSIKLSTAARQHDYINNDLRDANKMTNKTAAEGVHTSTVQDKNEAGHTKQKETCRMTSGKRSGSGTGRINGSFIKEKRKMTDDGTNYKYADTQNGHRFRHANLDREKYEKWLGVAWEKLVMWSCFLFTHTKALLVNALGILLFLTYSAFHLTWFAVSKCWMAIRTKVNAKLGKTTNDNSSWRSKESTKRRIGLEEKIALPSTGEEAMKRLLACKGKDPYSILGVRQDSSEEDIKKYYKKQAVLVHPDKNQEPGAEEAFKILGHAFEKIGEPSKRKEYDTQAVVESESELRKEFVDLISKLQTKIQEAANLMPCDNCGNKHRRVPVDRPFYSARFCQRCNIRHPAKEGDVWAESSMLGFYWNYYALMEGHVYDITEWMKCHQEFYKRMRANEHTVLTRIATDGNKKPKHHHNRDPNLEEFFNRIFSKMPGSPGGASSQSNGSQSPHRGDAGWGQASGSNAGAKKAGGGKRKKKRH